MKKNHQTLKSLKAIRAQIDQADREMILALAKRFKSVQKMGLIKKQFSLPVLQAKRWNDVLKSRVRFAKKAKLSATLIKNIFAEIHRESLSLQNSILNEKVSPHQKVHRRSKSRPSQKRISKKVN